eukprot:5447309-Lingulodinium_polyedra.AAC.1
MLETPAGRWGAAAPEHARGDGLDAWTLHARGPAKPSGGAPLEMTPSHGLALEVLGPRDHR